MRSSCVVVDLSAAFFTIALSSGGDGDCGNSPLASAALLVLMVSRVVARRLEERVWRR